ncbi:MAG: VanZ family protein [Chloroflexi bacterium]|nr:VanZ family protein [Chloroflexota bacterium]
MLYFTPFPLLAGLATLAVLLSILWHQKRSLAYLFFFSAFWLYLLILISVTLFPIPIPEAGIFLTKQQLTFVFSHVNFVPFKYLSDPYANPCVVFLEIVQNILLTIPFGFGVSFIAQFKARDFLWLAIAVGFTIEIAQLVISLGAGVYRTVDITDVLLNATGILLGYGIFRIFAWLYLVITQHFKITHRGLLAYIHEVVNQAQAIKLP